MNFEDLSGKVFPHFTVKRPIYKDYKGKQKLYWECECECGNNFFATKTNIKTEKIKSCGCYQKEYQRKKKLSEGKINIGNVFGILKVVDITLGDDGRNVYTCECECGNKITLSSSHLKKRYSCGCMTSGYIEGTNVSKESFIHLGKKTKRNTSGCVGVTWRSNKQKWQARIYFAGKNYHLGYYDNKEDAIRARKIAENDIYDDFNTFIDKCKNKNNAYTGE